MTRCPTPLERRTTPFWQGILEHSEEAGTFTRQTGNSPAATKQASHAQTLSHLVRSIHKNLKEDIQVEEKWRAKLKVLPTISLPITMHSAKKRAARNSKPAMATSQRVLSTPRPDEHSQLQPSTGAHDAARRATPLQRGHGAGGASTGKAHGFAANQKTKAERRINMVPVQPQVGRLVSPRLFPFRFLFPLLFLFPFPFAVSPLTPQGFVSRPKD